MHQENIKLSQYEYYMSFAIKEAEKALQVGEFPVGCVVVQNNKIISASSRKGTTSKIGIFSEIDHAEIIALKKIEVSNKKNDLEKSILFCTMEPCLMCFAAIILSGIKKIVYAYEDPMGGGTCCDIASLTPLYKQSKIKIVSGVLREKSLELFKIFFKNKKKLYLENSLLEHYTIKQAE
ncbi:MAG: tRNA-specific adenosine deaminase [Desulfobacteraceae bacterium 4572_130]|nr:MAG: tRNA-specific adenosine deaminase [Desulfobacteraceae bacterium 4572_130]